jgi:hypothetical protein
MRRNDQRRWRFDVVPDWIDQQRHPRSMKQGRAGGPSKQRQIGQSISVPYHGLGPYHHRPPMEGYGPMDEPSPACVHCGAEALCSDWICGVCGQHNFGVALKAGKKRGR